jgi:tetratricopeptide (TPR) repeat protein
VNDTQGAEGANASSSRQSEGIAWTTLGAASREEADAFLGEQRKLTREQAALTRLQASELEHELRLRHWSLRVHHISDVLKLGFELAVAFILLALASAVAAEIWAAVHADGLVIEAFSVPPDLAEKGLTGEVVAAKVLDRLSQLQAETGSSRAATSYANNWGSDIKVQIPDTGVSIGEVNRYLRNLLGRETHISGAIYHIVQGIAVTTRAGSASSPIFTGPESDLDELIRRSAEAVYRTTQPYRYAVWLLKHDRQTEAYVVFRQLLATGSADDRAWAYGLLANDVPIQTGNFEKGRQLALESLAINPKLILARENLIQNESLQQHDEQQLIALRDMIAAEAQGRDSTVDPDYFNVAALQDQSNLADLLGEYAVARDLNRQIESLPDKSGSVEVARNNIVAACAGLHDEQCMQDALAGLPPNAAPNVTLNRVGTKQQADALLLRWGDALAPEPQIAAALAKMGIVGSVFLHRLELPSVALAHAHLGNLAAAHSEIDQSPLDCVMCLRNRGNIATLERRWNAAQFWFARAVAAAPSVPFGYADWGVMLLAKGDADGAIAKFTIANRKAPHYADPLEMWGEALIKKNRSDLAITKFVEANQYAPHWGRLHLAWGEALYFAGKKDEAKKQFAIAANLGLSEADKVELKKWISRRG